MVSMETDELKKKNKKFLYNFLNNRKILIWNNTEFLPRSTTSATDDQQLCLTIMKIACNNTVFKVKIS